MYESINATCLIAFSYMVKNSLPIKMQKFLLTSKFMMATELKQQLTLEIADMQ